MSEVPFYQTRAGRTYYEVHVPRLIEGIERLTEAVEELVEQDTEDIEGEGE